MEPHRVGIAGAGRSGQEIAQILLATVPQVVLYDLNANALDEALQYIENALYGIVQSGRLTDWVKEKQLKNIRITTQLEELARCDLIIEAVPEQEEIKAELFEALDELCDKQTVFASNTSSLSITRLAAVTERPERFIGLHFIRTPPRPTQTGDQEQRLVEIVRGWKTSDDTFARAKRFIEQLGMIPLAAQDSPGFLVNRILVPMINEAVTALAEGVGTVEMIDQAMTVGAACSIGPLAMADWIGLDVCLDVMEVLFSEFGDMKYRPAPLLRKYVDANFLGRKTDRGFYTYPASPPVSASPTLRNANNRSERF